MKKKIILISYFILGYLISNIHFIFLNKSLIKQIKFITYINTYIISLYLLFNFYNLNKETAFKLFLYNIGSYLYFFYKINSHKYTFLIELFIFLNIFFIFNLLLLKIIKDINLNEILKYYISIIIVTFLYFNILLLKFYYNNRSLLEILLYINPFLAISRFFPNYDILRQYFFYEYIQLTPNLPPFHYPTKKDIWIIWITLIILEILISVILNKIKKK